MRRNLLVWAVCLLLFQGGTVLAQENPEISVGLGRTKDDIEVYRIGIKKNFERRFFETDVGWLSGYCEAAVNYWSHDQDSITAVTIAPVLVYYFGSPESNLHPYIEAGIGAAFLSDTRIGQRDMSTTFQFEDRIGLGIKYDRLDIILRFLHYSNADIKKPNDGIDIFMVAASYQF